MTYVRRSSIGEQKEAAQKAEHITVLCKKLHITLDPIDWQSSGMRADVTVNGIKIGDLLGLSQQESDSVLRHVQIKLFEQAALTTIPARPGLKAVMWNPIEVVQPQEFLSLWSIRLETVESIAVAEYIDGEERVYKPYILDVTDRQQIAKLFGPMHTGKYNVGDIVPIEEHERKFTGEIVYILPPGKPSTNRKYPSRGQNTPAGRAYGNDITARYLVHCQDGFPHIVNQSQITVDPATLPS